MRSLEYETRARPAEKGTGALAYWAAFGLGTIPGFALAAFVDQSIYYARTGHHADGGATGISTGGIPMAAAVAAVARLARRSRVGWWFAALCGVAAQPVTVAVLYHVWR